MQGEILHGSIDYISRRILQLHAIGEALRQLNHSRLGVIGQPSDWLISSNADRVAIRQQLGIELVDIDLQAILDAVASMETDEPDTTAYLPYATTEHLRLSLPDALRIYLSLRRVVEERQLDGLTLRCFDLLSTLHNTGCLALARLNSEGFVAGCEGDVPAMLSMMIVRSLLGISGFQANPAYIDQETDGKQQESEGNPETMLFAHCTIPLNMVERYELDTHFESGIGVGIRGYMKEGPVTVFKVAGNLSRSFIAEGELVRNQSKPDLCRTQQLIRFADRHQTDYFLTHPIGNHHVIRPGHHRELLENLVRML